MAEINLTQLVQQPTHLHPTPTCLDHIVTNIGHSHVTVLHTAFSDHQPVILEAPVGRLRRRPVYHYTRSWRTADWDAISLDFLLADWDCLHSRADVNLMVDDFMIIWTEVIDRHCPVRRRRIRHPDCPWLTDNQSLRAAMAALDAPRVVWKAHPPPEVADKYRHLRNHVKSLLNAARRD